MLAKSFTASASVVPIKRTGTSCLIAPSLIMEANVWAASSRTGSS